MTEPTRVHLEYTLYAGTAATVELPEGKTWEDVASWGVKWDTLHIEFKDSTECEIALESETMDIIDWKRPATVSIYAVDGDGEPDYDDLLSEEP